MKIVIAGGGKVGGTLTRQLSEEDHDITLIDSKSKILDESMEACDVMAVQGNCASVNALYQAGIEDADLLIAATNADEVNLLCCMTAHGLNPKLHTIARIRNPEYTDQIYSMRDIFALSMTVNPELQAAIEIERLLKYPGFLKRDTFAKGRVELVELRIDGQSKLKDVSLIDLDKVVRSKVLICAVLRNGKAVIPAGDFVLKEGDRIFVTAPIRNLTILLKSLGIITHRVKRVMICGGGPVSYYLAKRLEKSGMSVQIIESKPERCRHLAEILPEASIIEGDASNQILLDSEGLDGCDAFVSATGLDEVNMVISMYANNRGVPQVITKIGHLEKSSIWDVLPLGSVICPKELCGNTIVRYVRAMQNQTGAAVTIYSIADGQVEAMEFLVDEKTLHCGEPLRMLKLKKNVLVACITRGAEAEIASGDSSFQVGDMVIVVTRSGKIIHQLNDIFD
ncbi:MAG: Trk system potassium transporter TrkA [Clostridiales bacterium]|nr:Trk system potassium transporter TrkA [Clostridiales bacterium]